MSAPDRSRPADEPASTEFSGPTLHGSAVRTSGQSAGAGAPQEGHWSSADPDATAVGAVPAASDAARPGTSAASSPPSSGATSSGAASSGAASSPTASSSATDSTTALPQIPAVGVVSAGGPSRPGGPGGPSGPGGPGGSGGSGRPARPPKPVRGPRRAHLQLRGISVWSALRFSVVLSIALFCVWMVMVGVLYGILDGVGAIDKVNEAIYKIDPNGPREVVRPGMVFGGGIVIGSVYMVLFIALSTVGTVIYNLCADLVGGVEVTLAERD